MRIFEVTNPEEQLGLLKLIIDNTWTAIQQQADEQRARNTTKQLQSKLKAGRQVMPTLRPKQAMPATSSKAVNANGRGDDDEESGDEIDDDAKADNNNSELDSLTNDSEEENNN